MRIFMEGKYIDDAPDQMGFTLETFPPSEGGNRAMIERIRELSAGGDKWDMYPDAKGLRVRENPFQIGGKVRIARDYIQFHNFGGWYWSEGEVTGFVRDELGCLYANISTSGFQTTLKLTYLEKA